MPIDLPAGSSADADGANGDSPNVGERLCTPRPTGAHAIYAADRGLVVLGWPYRGGRRFLTWLKAAVPSTHRRWAPAASAWGIRAPYCDAAVEELRRRWPDARVVVDRGRAGTDGASGRGHAVCDVF